MRVRWPSVPGYSITRSTMSPSSSSSSQNRDTRFRYSSVLRRGRNPTQPLLIVSSAGTTRRLLLEHGSSVLSGHLVTHVTSSPVPGSGELVPASAARKVVSLPSGCAIQRPSLSPSALRNTTNLLSRDHTGPLAGLSPPSRPLICPVNGLGHTRHRGVRNPPDVQALLLDLGLNRLLEVALCCSHGGGLFSGGCCAWHLIKADVDPPTEWVIAKGCN
jgi:hypothetical protein